ncbi:MAG: glutamine amidotransferase [Gammaproteobacteria bacterium]
MKTATVIRHLGFEDLGSFAEVLEMHDYHIQYREAGLDDLAVSDPLASELTIILGGPLGVYQEADYPYLSTEIDIARRRIDAARPTLGICLGSQIMARALGAEVLVAEKDEVGWAPIELTAEGRISPLAHLEGVHVLHWHGDRFELPADAERLAATPACPNQAFRISNYLLAVQFHPEVNWPELERWLIGHTRALTERNESIPRLRAESRRNCSTLEPAARRMLEDWLSGLS